MCDARTVVSLKKVFIRDSKYPHMGTKQKFLAFCDLLIESLCEMSLNCTCTVVLIFVC